MPYQILAINPGSTSTKVALFSGDTLLAEKIIRHNAEDFAGCQTVMAQKGIRTGLVLGFLAEQHIEKDGLSAVVGRGGLIKPVESGTYAVNDEMLADLEKGVSGLHASSLGGIIAHEIGLEYRVPAYIVDPVVVDELQPVARLSGIPGVERKSIFHALNAKAVAKDAVRELGMPYENARLVVAHLGGGISVGAHCRGRVVDVNDGLSGEGPFSPERSGSAPLSPIIEMCYSGQYTKDEMVALVTRRAGVQAYLGSSDMMKVEQMVRDGDEYATLVVDAMAYQIAKEIGAMAAVLEGAPDAIVLTGGLARFGALVQGIERRVGKMARVLCYPGEDEMLALAKGALGVLAGKEQAKDYPKKAG